MAKKRGSKLKRDAFNAVKELIESGKSYVAEHEAVRLGIPSTSFRRYQDKIKGKMDITIKDRRKAKVDRRRTDLKRKGGGGLEKFRELYDNSLIIPQLIEQGVEKYLVDKDGKPDWRYDSEFREMCRVPAGKWRRYADDYKHLQATKAGEIIWAHPKIIDEIRRILFS